MHKLILLSAVVLHGCASYQWQKDGSSQLDYAVDKYNCMIEAQERVVISRTRQDAVSKRDDYEDKMVTNQPMYRACMEALGWERKKVKNE